MGPYIHAVAIRDNAAGGNDVMYLATSFHQLFALHAKTVAMLWQFDLTFDHATRVTLLFSRGVRLHGAELGSRVPCQRG
jgi:glucose dehydrogenase